MASSVSWQDELNPALWLATQAGKRALSVPQVKFPPNPYSKSFIDQACLYTVLLLWQIQSWNLNMTVFRAIYKAS